MFCGLVTPVSFLDAENEQLISEDSIENLNDPDIQINSKMLSSSRLNNSDILNNLDSKLAHLNPEGREELAQLMLITNTCFLLSFLRQTKYFMMLTLATQCQ